MSFTSAMAIDWTIMRAAAPIPCRSSTEFGLHGLDDAILVVLGELRVHWQTDDLVRDAIAHRQSVAGHRIGAIGGLAMKRQGIIDRRRYAARPEASRESITPRRRDGDRVLRPYRRGAVDQLRHAGDGCKLGVVVRRDAIAILDLRGKDAQLLDEDRRLQCVHPAVDADVYVVVLVGALAMNTQASQQRRKLIIVGKHCATVTVAAQRLGRIEAGRRGSADRADVTTSVAGTEALRGIAHEPQIVRCAYGLDPVIVGRLTEQIHGNDPRRVEPMSPGGADRGFEAR